MRTRMLSDQIGERITALSGADFEGPMTVREETPKPVDRPSAAPRGGEAGSHKPGRREFSKIGADAAPPGKAIATTTSALLRWLSPRPFEPRAGPPETTRLGSRLPDVPLQFEAIQNQIRSAKLPLGSGVARVEQQ